MAMLGIWVTGINIYFTTKTQWYWYNITWLLLLSVFNLAKKLEYWSVLQLQAAECPGLLPVSSVQHSHVGVQRLWTVTRFT
jgi:hypothetical protein